MCIASFIGVRAVDRSYFFSLKYAVEMHGGKDWVAIAALVPYRSKSQCHKRWHNVLKGAIDLA
jgi:hypothetical protein